MTVRYPGYYDDFTCIAGECEDTCCAGWEIDIDGESYEYYQSLPGEFGERVRASIKQAAPEGEDVYETHGFILREGKRCPFLQEDGLCEMIRTLGEDALCDVCTYTPRNFLEYGGMREISISPSCPEAGRLIFGSREPVEFVTRQEPGELEIQEGEEECLRGQQIRRARDIALEILQERTYAIEERMAAFLFYARKVQEALNEDSPEKMAALGEREPFLRRGREALAGGDDGHTGVQFFLKRFTLFSSLAGISREWEGCLERMEKRFLAGARGESCYREDMAGYLSRLEREGREFEWEQLAVYLAFLMVSRCVDDWNFWGKAQFVAVSWLFVRDMDALRYGEKGTFTVSDRVDVMRVFAREVEHSQENLALLDEEFLFGEEYSLEALLEQLKQCEYICME